MTSQEISIQISKPIDEVFAFTINPKNTPTWIDTIVAEETNEWPPKVGTIYRNKTATSNWSEYTMTEFETNKTFVLSKQDGFHIRYTFIPVDTQTTELQFHLWMDNGELKNTFTMETLEKLKQKIEV